MPTKQDHESSPLASRGGPVDPSHRGPWGRVLGAWGGLSLAGLWVGGIVGALAVGANDSIASASDGLILWAWVVLAYALVFVPAGLISALLATFWLPRRIRKWAPPTSWSYVGLLAFLGYSLGSRAVQWVRPWATEVDRSSMAAGSALAILALGLGILIAQGWGVRLGRRWALPPTLGLLLSPAWVAFETRQPDPTPDDVVWDLDPDQDPAPVVLVGIDGADPKDVERLIGEGRLPHLANLVDRGTLAPLQTIRPTWSPIIWNTIATGQPGSEHRILDFTEIPVPGVSQGVQGLRVVERLAQGAGQSKFASTPGHVGLTPMVYGLVRRNRLEERPIRAHHRRVKALWNMLSDVGLQIGVIGWWATSPAERVDGWLVGDDGPRHHALRLRDPDQPFALSGAATWPPDYIQTLAEVQPGSLFGPSLPWNPEDRDTSARTVLGGSLFQDLDEALHGPLIDDWPCLQLAHDVLEDDRFNADTANRLIREQSPPFLAVYWNGVDALSHRIERHQKRDPRFRKAVDRYYEEIDHLLGTLLEHERPRTTYVLVSDHGWSYDPTLYGHYHAPHGILLVAGHHARVSENPPAPTESGTGLGQGTEQEHGQGFPPPANIEDITPTILHLFGLPASEEMPGRVLLEYLQPRATQARIASWGTHAPQFSEFADAIDGGLNAEDQLEKLRALGYVK